MKLFQEALLDQLTGNAKDLANQIQSKDALIGVIGLGYVGMPIALEFCKKGFKCVGVDVSEKKVESLNAGKNFIEDLKDEEVADVVAAGLMTAHTDYSVLADADVIFIAVPTPFNANKDPDLEFILAAGAGISGVLKPGQLVILKSTTFPGTTEDYLIPELEKSGLKAGGDFFVAFSPERVDPGNKVYHTGNTPIVVGGIDSISSTLAGWTNRQIIEQVYLVDNPKVAELEKLLENIFRSVNIALVNEMALLCERMGGINVWEVIEAASTKPFGYMKFTPGPGVGGHCIPIDPYYLSWLAREHDFETKFITLAANVNESMPYHVVNLVIREIAKQPVTLGDAKILILGASFKKNVKDLRHSPSEAIILRLIESGIHNIEVSDPWAPTYNAANRVFYSVDLTEESLAEYDCVILVTDHDDFDIPFVVKHAKCVVDTRNMTKDVEEGREKIVLLGEALPKPKLVLEH
ncbi:nucleotide sugar dehydrogenase [Pontibacter sp. G13]|uniref:nucleotide sugar dehydrogenase n=1 Tax=Pontibacter sp. G13 TaxID=3074898 RepID=UPI00288BD4AD|nr:nucleotide sugar dehydrogenase [Pontibacter sp. G13]WNJ20147.1 nucleotide sugar dehydrogenase [Pontibacter sp. G13]